MKVIIIGAGLGGLTAAFAFAKAGHDVQVLERSPKLNPTGGGISVRPSASKVIQGWGLQKALEQICDRSPSVTYRELKTGEVRTTVVDSFEHADWGTTRRAMVKLLHHVATEAGAQIRFSANVARVSDDAAKATVTLESGQEIVADIILAADGIKSHTRRTVLSDVGSPEQWDPIVDNTTFYSFDMAVSELTDDPTSMKLTENSNITTWKGDGGFAVTRYSSRFGRVGLLFAIQGETDQKSLWDEKGDIEYVRRFFSGVCSDMVKALSIAKTCDRWRIAEVPNLPRWSSQAGRIVLLGDAAHAMHPNAAQGYSTIIEDIGVLQFLFSSLPGSTVPEIVSVWQAICKPRAERVKEFSRWNTKHLSGKTEHAIGVSHADSLLDSVVPDRNADFSSLEFWKWNVEYDAVGEAKRYLEKKTTPSKL
ncbi:FAD/NAD(P)-binding domain-containing protein [Trichoderma citrinoviride]|uniref:FAD/NAD(P)-binding domain-containing protein n=1 Tax=Trichoderma citrinoviride TaxID=58853 RepID=A0A2T4BCK1_9HYPO|nr:FAD/NAD(P)-binding domain-containing protein [Trichoderma citrinoviride]PTB67008.1 FAD/NAD(P)-binding domain-containing protein [Trichoderma citrinoviride]